MKAAGVKCEMPQRQNVFGVNEELSPAWWPQTRAFLCPFVLRRRACRRIQTVFVRLWLHFMQRMRPTCV